MIRNILSSVKNDVVDLAILWDLFSKGDYVEKRRMDERVFKNI